MGDLNDDTPRRARAQPRSTVGGIFKGFRIRFRIERITLSQSLIGNIPADPLMLQTDVQNNGENAILDGLAALITGVQIAHAPGNGLYTAYLDEHCKWLHLGRQKDHDYVSQQLVAILHPEDSHSLLILENTDDGLFIVPQGRWQSEIGGQVGKLAAQWALANMPPEALNRSPHGKTLGYYPQQRPNENIS